MTLRRILPLLLLLAPALTLAAEAWKIDTFAGSGEKALGPASKAREVAIGQPFGVEIGPTGRVYVTEVENHRIWKIDPQSGAAEVVVGSGKKGYAGDGGQAAKALLNEPYELRFDAAGNMFFVEMQNHLIRRVDARTGVISTVAGAGVAGFGGDGGPAAKAQFKQPHSLVLDRAGNLYIADIGNHRIRRIDAASGTITTVAGDGTPKLPLPGAAARGAPLRGPRALALQSEPAGETLWIALREGNSVWRLDLATGKIWPVAGSGEKGFSDGPPGMAEKATFNGPKGIAVGPDRRLYVVDTENQAIRAIDPERKTVTTIAGVGPAGRGFRGDGGEALGAHFARPHGLGIAADGTIYIGDSENHRVRVLTRGK